ncbi:Gfo/Idh/MocA family oxidoreductase [Porifericola rhodea]|uniref:Gfo/Idh/MocA family protein n=1 Tax=Porifericola rhodea TaxID=930972 RepID=UPI0026664387|nr:Gfo/Idh/MocA family oxidoreductase [Porifericola rhodea]WKN32272.1 Gfo/Idh/MocA family oxidoreductase [Porifericola rhodea]
MQHPIKRRKFIRQSSLGALGLSMFPFNKKVAPSDKLRVAHIGVGGMGMAHLNWFANLPEVDVVAICDVDNLHLSKGLAKARELQPGVKVSGYSDFRQLLENKDIDAITCATPDHWHAQIAMLAFEAGKDVYGEKPLAYSVKEGQQMLKSMERHGKIFQLGTQIHAGDNYHRVAELIQAGAIGKVSKVRLWKTGDTPKLGQPKVQAVPKNLNWDMWLGPAPYTEYMPERCHFNFRYFLDYSGGMFQDFWCHIADVVWWSVQPGGLKSLRAEGEAPKNSIADVPEWINIDYKFDNLDIYWTSKVPEIPGAEGRGIGAYFEGSKGTLLCDYSRRELRINGEVMEDIPEIEQTIARSPGHQQNFVDAVKNRTLPESHLAYAREMTLPMHLGLISFRLGGRALEWNSKKEKFRGDKEANALLERENRKEWNLA